MGGAAVMRNLTKLVLLPISLAVVFLFQNCSKDSKLNPSEIKDTGKEESSSVVSPEKYLIPNDTEPELSSTVFNSELKIKAPRLYAGAINSMTFRGVEYIDTADHGRQLQTAVSFDGHGECYNPTEAGSRDDHLKNPDVSTSVLLSTYRGQNYLETTTDAGFWLYPTETQYRNPLNPSLGCANKPGDFGTKNTKYRDNYLIHKTVLVGYKGIQNILQYKVDYTLPKDHVSANFESLTGYMTLRFNKIYSYNTDNGNLERLGWEPMGEQLYPLVVATEDNAHAMGIYTLSSYEKIPSYGRFDFSAHGSYKWNTVHRISPLTKGTYSFTHFVAFGTVQEVQDAMNKITCVHPPRNLPFNASRCNAPLPSDPKSCVPYNKKTCLVTNGQGEETCNATGTGYGTCEVTSCNPGYVPSGGACIVSTGSQMNIASHEIYKSHNSTDGSYLFSISSNEGAPFGYQSLGSAFYLASGQGMAATMAVYRCIRQDSANQVVDRMLSLDSNCEGYKTEGVIGYAMKTRQAQNVCFAGSCRAVKELYRCLDAKSGKHLSTLNSADCKGNFAIEGTLGFAW